MRWPTRVPGQPYLWVLDLTTGEPADECATHHGRVTAEGVCPRCTVDWFLSLGGDPDQVRQCNVCRLPLHPAVIAEGFEVHPVCDFTHVPEDWT